LIDVFGHLLVVKRGEESLSVAKATDKIKGALPDFQALTPFITLEAIVVGNGKLNGVVVQGIDEKTVDTVLRLKSRIVSGSFTLGRQAEHGRSEDEPAYAVVGKALAARFGLKSGDTFRVVLPRPSEHDTAAFTSKVAVFKVAGILDFGKADYDERTVITSLEETRRLGGIQAPFTGLRVRLKHPDRAQGAALDLIRELGSSWWVMDWTEGNRNLFRAIKYERVAIFFVILIMVIAASFNVASNIYIGVLRRTSEISILRALGFSKREISSLFRMQGLLFGVLGVVVGLSLGALLGGLFIWAQTQFQLLPAEVYKLNHIGVEFSTADVFVISLTAIAICVLASLGPAKRAAGLDPIEGLRHE
jgi:lipoprotein-releasing system permease protein